MLEAILDATDGDLRVLACAVHPGSEGIGRILICLGIHGHGLNAAGTVGACVHVRPDVVTVICLILINDQRGAEIFFAAGQLPLRLEEYCMESVVDDVVDILDTQAFLGLTH